MDTINDDILRLITSKLTNVSLMPLSCVSRRLRRFCSRIKLNRLGFMTECFLEGRLELFKWGHSMHFPMLDIYAETLLTHGRLNDEQVYNFAKFLASIGLPVNMFQDDYDQVRKFLNDRYALARALRLLGCIKAEHLARLAAANNHPEDMGKMLMASELVTVQPSAAMIANCFEDAVRGGHYNTARALVYWMSWETLQSQGLTIIISLNIAKLHGWTHLIAMLIRHLFGEEVAPVFEHCVDMRYFELLHWVGYIYKTYHFEWLWEMNLRCLLARERQIFGNCPKIREYMGVNGCICCKPLPKRAKRTHSAPTGTWVQKYQRVDPTD